MVSRLLAELALVLLIALAAPEPAFANDYAEPSIERVVTLSVTIAESDSCANAETDCPDANVDSEGDLAATGGFDLGLLAGVGALIGLLGVGVHLAASPRRGESTSSR